MELLLLKLGNEVRQGIHHMLGLLDFAAEEPLTSGQLECFDRCRAAADRLLRTAGDLAELDHTSTRPRQLAPFDLPEAIQEIAALMGTLAGRVGLEFHCYVDIPPMPPVLGDKFLIQDILRRLLDNAIQFTSSGNISITAVSSNPPGGTGMLTVEICDTGGGIPNVVEAFLGGDGEPPEQGLSLRVIKNRLADLGGSIGVQANVPQGTRIRCNLPLALAPCAELVPDAKRAHTLLKSLHLLIAEDSDDSFLLFKAYLKSEGHRISRALNGADAVEMAKREQYDFIVMDVNMPQMDGYTATRQIREWETVQGRARLPILLISADDASRQFTIGGAAGCSGFLTKPTTKAKVLAALNYYAQSPLELAGPFLN